MKALSKAFMRVPVKHTQTNERAYTVHSHIHRKRRWMGIPGWQTGDPCHLWCPPSLCPPPVPFQLITVSWFIQTIHQSGSDYSSPQNMNNKAPQAMSQHVGHYHTLNVPLFIAERRKKTSVFVCAWVGFGQNHPHFTGRGFLSIAPARIHSDILHSKGLMDNSHWNNWLFVHWSGWVNNGWLHQGLLHPERLTDSSL